MPFLFDLTCPYVFDNGENSPAFINRTGWTWEELKDVVGGKLVEDDQKIPTRAASLIQAWLFFGSIQFITRIAVDTNL